MTGGKTYEDLVRWAYVGEVWGQAMLERLIELDVFPTETEHLQVLLALETRTRLRLQSIIGSVPQLADSERESVQSGVEYAEGLKEAADWTAWMAETREMTSGYVPDFERLLELGPDAVTPVLQETLEHELSVVQYAEHRLHGRRDAAVRTVVDHLAKWGDGPANRSGHPSPV